MSIIDKIDELLNEATIPSQSKFMSVMSNGLKDVSDITSMVAMSLWHYVNPRIIGKGGGNIYKSQPSNKIMDELWYRIGRSVEDSEHLTDDGLKKLKKNFYSLGKDFMNIYKMDSTGKAWTTTGFGIK